MGQLLSQPARIVLTNFAAPSAVAQVHDGPIHTTALSSIRDVDALQQESDLWEAAVSKWQLTFGLVNYAGPVGERLRAAAKAEHNTDSERSIIGDVLGIKSPSPASKRADSLHKYFTRRRSGMRNLASVCEQGAGLPLRE